MNILSEGHCSCSRKCFNQSINRHLCSLPVALMQRDGQLPPDDGQTPYQVPRPCDHCATVLPESELVPYPKSSLYSVDAPELLCGPCWERNRSRIRRSKYRAISEQCLMDHHLEKTNSYDIANCMACGAPFFRGAVMFECTTCTDRWTYCVDCKRAWDLRPSHNQRQHNAQARARGKALYQLAPTRQASERDMPAVGEEQQEEEKEEGGQGGEEQEEEDVVTALTPSIVEELAARFVDITGYSMMHARAFLRAHQGNLEAALRAHLATWDSEERLAKELLELFNVSGATSSSSSRTRWRRSRGTS